MSSNIVINTTVPLLWVIYTVQVESSPKHLFDHQKPAYVSLQRDTKEVDKKKLMSFLHELVNCH